MGISKVPVSTKLFLAIMYVDEAIMEKALNKCIEKFGTIDKKFGPLEVSAYTDYYDKEMGKGIKKYYITFEKLIKRSNLSSIKIFTNKIEKKYLNKGNRTVNLDPGYITNDKLVLATTKDFFHRIYLDNGIYAEVTLHFRKGRYRYFSWTYPDYKETEVQKFLEQARVQLVRKIRNLTKEINNKGNE